MSSLKAPDLRAETDVGSFLDQSPFSRFQLMVLALCLSIAAVDAIDLSAMGLVAPSLIDQWHISQGSFSPVLSISIAGTIVGAMLGGPIADTIGRRKLLIGSVFMFGVLTLCCAFASSVEWLIGLRLLAGFAMGAASPIATTLMSEYAPRSHRSITVNAQLIGFALGAAAGGWAASLLIPRFGWQSVLLFGGLLPVALACVLTVFLPESLQFMVAKQWPKPRIASVLDRISRGSGGMAGGMTVNTPAPSSPFAKVGTILKPAYRPGTLVLWFLYFLGLVIYYLITSWLPTVIHAAGFTVSEAAWVTSMFPLGGALGLLVLGLLMDRFSSIKVIACTFALGGIAIWFIGTQANSILLLATLVFSAGATLIGALFSTITIATGYYPALIRGTGVTWMIAVGRIGGIAGATVGGQLLQLGWSFDSIFRLLSVPSFVAAVSLFLAAALFNKGKAGNASPA